MTPQTTRQEDVPKDKEQKVNVNTVICLDDVPFQIARPLVISMSLFGLLHLSGKERKWAPFTKIYATIVLLLLWSILIKGFTLYDPKGSLLLKIIMHCWQFQCACVATATYLACIKQNHVVEFVTRWTNLLKLHQDYYQELTDVSSNGLIKKAKLGTYICFVCSWGAFFISVGLFGYILFRTDSLDFLISPLTPSDQNAFPMKCSVFVLNLYGSAAWVFGLSLFYEMRSVICIEFQTCHKDLEEAVQPDGDVVGFETHRRRHQEICRLLVNADDILSGFSAVSIVTSTVNGMLVLYNLLWNRETSADLVVLLTNLFWLFSCLLYLGVIAVGGGYLNHLAHSPLKTIHNIQLKTISTEVSLQMTMFLSKLTGEPIGLTAMGMFVINKPTILTIAGAFLTYFIVLVQFQQPAGQQECLTNCTFPCVG